MCAPVDGFTNGGFATGNANGWTVQGDKVVVGGDGAAEGNDPYDIILDFPNDGDHTTVISQDVKLCPGTNYEMTFSGRRVYGDGNCQLRATLGNRVLQDWKYIPATLTTWQYYGQYLVNAFHVGDGDATTDGLGLKVRFGLTVVCNGGRGRWSTIRFDSFSVYPV